MSARTGWRSVNITPPLGLPMGGRGPRFTPGASILDPLTASATFVEDTEGRRVLIVSLDLIGLNFRSSAHLTNDLAALTGTPPAGVVLNFAHTHSGPMTNFDKYATINNDTEEMRAYESWLHGTVCLLAVAAQNSIRPVAFRHVTGRSQVGINRRNRDDSGAMGLRPNPNGHYNEDVNVLELKATDCGDSCLLFSYGCHPVLVYGFAYDAISADWVRRCRRTLISRLGAGTHCQFIQGLAGNVRPRIVADLDGNRFRKATEDDVDAVGTSLADSVLNALSTSGTSGDITLGMVSDTVLLPRDLSVAYSDSYWRELANEGDELRQNLGRYWLERLERELPPVSYVPWQIGLMRWSSDVVVAWLSGEPVAEWQNRVREALDDDGVICWGYCQNVPSYLPTDELIPEGGYEVVQSNFHGQDGPGPFAPGLNQIIQSGYRKLASSL